MTVVTRNAEGKIVGHKPEGIAYVGANGLRVFSKVFAVLVGGLILMGALVTSHDAGLTVPDWPSSFGENMFLFPPSKWKGGIFYEHVHRLYASGVGLLTILLLVWTLKVETRRWVKIFTSFALFAVIVQGLLGGITVLMLLPTAVSASHGTIGQTFFVISIIIAYSHSRELQLLTDRVLTRSEQTSARAVFRGGMVLVALVYAQLIIAAIMRHSGAGLAFVDFPTHAGSWVPGFSPDVLERANRLRGMYRLPSVETFHLIFHALHRFMGYTILSVVYLYSWRINRDEHCPLLLKSTSFLATIVVSLQMMFGIATIASVRSPWVTSLHVLGGALLLVVSVLICVRSYVLWRKASIAESIARR